MDSSSTFTVDLEPLDPLPAIPVTHRLASAWAKYARAVEHFAELRVAATEVISATSANGALIPTPIRPGAFSIRAKLPEVPLRTSCLVGDVVHGLRTALDHAAWALATAHGFKGNRGKVHFPICANPKKYDDRRDSLTEMFGAVAVQVLEGLQPFHDRPGLVWLHDLDIVDKHESVLLMRHHLTVSDVVITDAAGRRVMKRHGETPAPPIIISDGGEMFRLEHDGDHLTGVHIAVEMGASLALAKGRAWPVDRVELIMRQAFHDVEDALLAIRDVLQPGVEEERFR